MKRVLITGASDGIGLETAKLLAARNYQLTLVARTEEKLEDAVKKLPGQGHKYIVADLTKKEDLEKITTHLRTEKYDVLINNAGAGLYGNFTDISLDQQIGIMYLNMGVLVMLSHAFLRGAKAGDALVNIGSILAHASFPGGAVYAGTKSFVANFSESLWYEFKDKGVFILGYNPGAARSGFHKNAGGSVEGFPDFVLSTTGQVAGELVAALEKRAKPRVVQGWKNRFMLFGFKLLSRKAAVNIMGGLSPVAR